MLFIILKMFVADQIKESVKGQKSQQLSTTISLHSSNPEHQARSEMGLAQPMVGFPPFALLLSFDFFL